MNRTLSLHLVNSLLTFLFIWKWLILNKSYSSCSREFTQGKCNTSTLREMKCQFIPHVHKIILYCISRVFSAPLKPIGHSRHKPLHSRNTQYLQCFHAIRDFTNYHLHCLHNTLFYQILLGDFIVVWVFFSSHGFFSVHTSTLRHSAPRRLPHTSTT